MIRALSAENRRTLSLAVPMIAGHIGQMLMGWVDTVMVGRLGVVPLGACGFANTLLSVPLVFGFGLLSAVSVHVSHAHGAGAPSRAAESVRGGLGVALLASAPVILGFHLLLPHIALFGQPAAVNVVVGNYLIICAWSMVPVFMTCVAKNFCEALGQPWQPFWIMLSGVALNAVLNWVLIFGNLGFPAMGLEGAAVATLISRAAVMVAVLSYPALSATLRTAWPKVWFASGLPAAAFAVLSLGLPAGALHLCEVSGFAFGSLMMGWLGVVPMAAHQIAITCAATTFMVPLGLSQAVCVRVGHARGGRQWERLRPIVFGGLGMAVAFMSLFVVVFIAFGSVIAGWFVSDQAVVRLAAQLLLVAGIFQIFDGIQVVSAGALRAFEDTRLPLGIGVFSYWLIALPVSWLAGFHFGLGARGVWIGFVVGLAAAAGFLFARLLWRLARIPGPSAA